MWSAHIKTYIAVGVILLTLAVFLEKSNSEPGFFRFDTGTFLGTALILLMIHGLISSVLFSVLSRYFILHHIGFVIIVHVTSIIVSSALLVGGFVVVSNTNDAAYARQYSARKKERKERANVVQLKKWWFAPNKDNPEQVHVIVKVTEEGEFSGFGFGRSNTDDEIILSSFNLTTEHKMVKKGDEFEVVYSIETPRPTTILSSVRLCLTLRTKDTRPGLEYISKFYQSEITVDDDGSFFYEVLPQQAEQHPTN